jgi:predicted GH43/DUF377 family glycosyl hydrolase
MPDISIKLLIPVTVFLLLVSCSERTAWELQPFVKYDGNPILKPEGTTWQSKDIFNPAAWADGDSIWLLYRAEDSTGIGRWNGTSRIGLAYTTDGLHFEREPDPVLEPDHDWELPGGCEDPRVVKIGDVFYLTYTGYDGQTARLAMASSTNLRSWEKHGVLFPDRGWTKSGAILATAIDGVYWMYFGDTNIWAAHSSDLRQWTVVEEPVLRPRPGYFDSRLVEPGPPPIMTDDGILLLYNGANDTLAYASGQVLLDRKNPSRVISRSETPFLRPSLDLEYTGQVSNVVFIEGLVWFKRRWFLYYGMGDSGIGVALCEE